MITIPQETLANALSAVTRASLKSSVMAALAVVRIDASADGTLKLSCFNGETAAQSKVYARIDDDASVCVDAQTLKAVADTMLGDVTFKIEPKALIIENGANRTTLHIIEESIPTIGEEQSDTIATLTGVVLRSLARVIPFASIDDSRQPLQVMYLRFGDNLVRAQAADGFSASYVEEALANTVTATVSLPLTFARLFASLVDERDTVLVQKVGDNRFLFQVTHTDSGKHLTLATVTAANSFPAEQVLQLFTGTKNSVVAHLQVSKNSLAQTVKMVAAMGTVTTFIKASNGAVKVASEENQIGQARNVLEGAASGQDASVWLSATFLKRVAEACKAEIRIGITDDKKPILLSEGSFTAMIMPLCMEKAKDPFSDEDEPIAISLPALETAAA
jgi:DNA polymerase III sliding clamp (beta) subunit (PCNA family)